MARAPTARGRLFWNASAPVAWKSEWYLFYSFLLCRLLLHSYFVCGRFFIRLMFFHLEDFTCKLQVRSMRTVNYPRGIYSENLALSDK